MNTLNPWRPDADWESFLVDRTFTGRQEEMDLLSRELLTSDAKAVVILGSAGMGKTTLAMMFGHLNRDFFSAGVYHVHATPVESLGRTVDAHVSNPTSPYLLVLDEVETRPEYELRFEIQELRRARPSARLICISRRQFLAAQVDLTIQLLGLKQAEFFELLAKTGAFVDNVGLNTELFEVLSGNVLATRLVSDLLQSGRSSPHELLLRLKGFLT